MTIKRTYQAVLTALFAAVTAAPTAYAYDETAIYEQISQLDWIQESGLQDVSTTNATYDLKDTEVMLNGSDAARFLELTQGTDNWDDTAFLTMTVAGRMSDSFVIYSHQPIGYIDDNDWESVDAERMMSQVKSAQRERNEERTAQGYPTLEVLGWEQTPQYDETLDAAYWAMQIGSSDGQLTINATALKLSRDGFTRITWVGTPEQFTDSHSTLVTASNAYQFNEGAQYADFSEGDKVAGVGLAALATGLMTGKGWTKKAGAGILALILVFLKKAWFIILLPLAFIKKIFTKNK